MERHEQVEVGPMEVSRISSRSMFRKLIVACLLGLYIVVAAPDYAYGPICRIGEKSP